MDHTAQCFKIGIQTRNGWAAVNTDKSKLSVSPNKWYRIAGSYDGSELRLYVDGNLMATIETRGPAPHGAYPDEQLRLEQRKANGS